MTGRLPEPSVCIGCGRRDTRDPSGICPACRRVGPAAPRFDRWDDRREDRRLVGGDRRVCMPGPALTEDDRESE